MLSITLRTSPKSFWWYARELMPLIRVALHFNDVHLQPHFIRKTLLLSFMRFLCCNWWICLMCNRCSTMNIVCNNVGMTIFILGLSWSILLICVSLSCSCMLLGRFVLRYWLMWGRLGLYMGYFTWWLGAGIWLESCARAGSSVAARTTKDMIVKESFMYN